MRCEKCGQRNAVVFLDHVTEKGHRRLSLCLECAVEAGIISRDLKLSFIPEKVMEGLFSASGRKADEAPKVPARVCPRCGTELSAFLASRRAGCARCWDVFAGQIVPPNQEDLRYRGRRRPPSGKVPSAPACDDRTLKIAMLRKRLARLVESERYEDAIAVRDALRKLDAGHPCG